MITNKYAGISQKMRAGPGIFDSQRVMFRELTTLLSTFSSGVNRWCDNWRHNLSTSVLDDRTSVTSGLAFLVEAASAMAASHARLAGDLTKNVVEPLTDFPKVLYRKNWFGRLKDVTEFEDECSAAETPLLDAVKKMEKAKRRYHDVAAKVARACSNAGRGAEVKVKKLRDEEELARLAYNNSAMAVVFCQRQCRQSMISAYAKAEELERRRLRFLESIVAGARHAFENCLDGDLHQLLTANLTACGVAVNVDEDLRLQRRDTGVDAPLKHPPVIETPTKATRVTTTTTIVPDASLIRREDRVNRRTTSMHVGPTNEETSVIIVEEAVSLPARADADPAVTFHRNVSKLLMRELLERRPVEGATPPSSGVRAIDVPPEMLDEVEEQNDDDDDNVSDNTTEALKGSVGDPTMDTSNLELLVGEMNRVNAYKRDASYLYAAGIVGDTYDVGRFDFSIDAVKNSAELAGAETESPPVFSPTGGCEIPSMYLKRHEATRLSDDGILNNFKYHRPTRPSDDDDGVFCSPKDRPPSYEASVGSGHKIPTHPQIPHFGKKRPGEMLACSTPTILGGERITPPVNATEFYSLPDSRFSVRTVTTPRTRASRRLKQGGIRFSLGSSVSPSPDRMKPVTHL